MSYSGIFKLFFTISYLITKSAKDSFKTAFSLRNSFTSSEVASPVSLPDKRFLPASINSLFHLLISGFTDTVFST